MKRVGFAVVLLTGTVLASACQSIVGIEDRSEAPPLDDGGAEATVTDASPAPLQTDASNADADLDPDAAPPAGCPVGCLPPAPSGWTGPSATYDAAESGKPADCPATYTEKEVESFVGLTAAPATCDCGAPTISGRKCTAVVSTHTSPDCSDLGTAEGTANSTSCFVTSSDVNSFYKVSSPSLVAGTCSFPNATATVPPKTYEKVEVACGLPQVTACEGRADCVATPAPAQPFTRLCIHKDGSVSCPSADYAVRVVAYKTVDDGRSCTTCTATPTGGACGTSWGNTAPALCGSLTPTDKTANSCYTYSGSGTSVNLRAMGPSAGTCTPAGGTPTGEAKSLDPVTFCCNQ